MKKAISLFMAAAAALSCSVSASALSLADEALIPSSPTATDQSLKEHKVAQTLKNVKSRITIPDELSEFNYNINTNIMGDSYIFNWSTKNDAEEYKYINTTICRNIITSYNSVLYDHYSSETQLAKLSADELYKAAEKAIMKLNPTVFNNISIDRESLNISLHNDRATFSIVRTNDGIPVNNDMGRVVVSKTTGELLSFNINWHHNATFKSADTAISESEAKHRYAEMISIYPQYELEYDFEKDEFISSIVYVQGDHGEINAFTGEKSDFAADGYFGSDDFVNEDSAAPMPEPEAGGNKNHFTEAELAELNKEFPYASEEKIRDILESNEYLTINDSMLLESSQLRKDTAGKTDRYYYSAYFSSVYPRDEYSWNKQYENVSIKVNAETGEIINYSYYKNNYKEKTTFDEAAATSTATEIAKSFAGDKLSEYGDINSTVNSYYTGNGINDVIHYMGSSHYFERYVNDIVVNGNYINIELDADNKLTYYSIDHTDAEFISPADILTPAEIMDKFWQTNDIELYYLARVHDRITKTVLVYGTESSIYCDAFTGEQKYNWVNIDKTDLSGITTQSIKEKAQILVDHGFTISSNKFSENDTVKRSELISMLNFYSSDENDKAINRGEAMILITQSACGDDIPGLKGIFKSPYTDISDNDENIGYYAIAHALTGSTATKLNASEPFTYGEMIELIYKMLAK